MKKSRRKSETQAHHGAGELRQTALNLLARREHSHRELERKLLERGFTGADIASLLEELTAKGWLSNTRFAEQYIHSRVQKGYGPLRIRAGLRERGVEVALVESLLAQDAAVWEARAVAARTKRFGSGLPEDFQERVRQSRFLHQRGYTPDQIRSALNWGHS